MRYQDNPIDTIPNLVLSKWLSWSGMVYWVARVRTSTTLLVARGIRPRDAALLLAIKLDERATPVSKHPLVQEFGDITKVVGGFDVSTTD